MSTLPAFISPLPSPGSGRYSHFLQVAPCWTLRQLQASAHIYGVSAPPPQTARVLEMGCGQGELALLMAQQYPQADIVGVCGTEQELQQAQQAAQAVRTANLTFIMLDQPDALAQLGSFDYVLVRNQYGLMAPEGREGLLAFIGAVLRPEGLACVDYPVYPGAKSHEIVRDGLLMQLNDVPAAQLDEAAKAGVTLLSSGLAQGMSLGPAVQQAAAELLANIDRVGAQRALAVEELPCYFVEFAGQVSRAGLSCVGDAEPWRDLAQSYGNEVALVNQTLALGQPPALRVQYLDFATGRNRRHTLLAHAQRVEGVHVNPWLERLRDLRWSSPFLRFENGESESGTVNYGDQVGRNLRTSDRMTIALLDVLAHHWPASVPFEDLAREPTVRAARRVPQQQVETELLASLTQCFLHDALYYGLAPGPYDTLVGVTPHVLPSLAQGLESAAGEQTEQVCAMITCNWQGEPICAQWTTQARQMLSTVVERGLTVQALMRSEIDDFSGVTLPPDLAPPRAGHGLVTAAALQQLIRLGGLVIDLGTWHAWLKLVLTVPGNRGNCWGMFLSSLIANGQTASDVRYLESDLLTVAQELGFSPQQLAAVTRLRDLLAQRAYTQTEQEARRLLERYPGMLVAHYALAASMWRLGRVDEALYELPTLLDAAGKDHFDIWMLAGSVLLEAGYPQGAIVAVRRASALAPHRPEAVRTLADACVRLFRYGEGVLHHRRFLEMMPGSLDARVGLANALSEFGAPDEAVDVMQPCLQDHAHELGVYPTLLYALNYSAVKSAEEIYASYQAFNRAAVQLYGTTPPAHRNRKRANRKLKIAYVSADFWLHAVSKFIEPVLQHHDRSAFEVTAYANQTKNDEMTQRLKGHVDKWVPVSGMSDAELVRRIREDEIDILVDLSGHTAGNRLRVFAQKPAPVSVSWLGFVYTTGLTAIDYFMTDEEMCPPGAEHLFSEQPWRLPGCNYVFRPMWEPLGEVGPLPALENGFITFGSLTRSIRVNDAVVDAWAAILRALPGSRLVVNSKSYMGAPDQNLLKQRFARRGIEPARLSVGYDSPPWDVLRGVDIALDCFPHNSGTTLFDGLCMGLPYITLAGRPSVGRLGASILRGLGRPEWIAHDAEAYVAKAVQLAADLPGLAGIRAGLRDELKRSPLLDEIGFTRKVEDAYRAMFQAWCERQA